MSDSYFVIDDNGAIKQMDKLEVLEHIQRITISRLGVFDSSQSLLYNIPDHNPHHWPKGSALIIKGKIVTPKLREVVSYDIE